MSKVKKLSRKVFSFPFKVAAICMGFLMMISMLFVALINGKSLDEFCEGVDVVINKLDELKAD